MRWLLCAVWVIFTFVASAQRDTIHHITVTQTDKFCQSGMDIDSCSYLPLYNSFYKWLGVPYRYSGDSKKGIDYSGLVKKVYREVYALDLNGSASDIYTRCEPIERKDLQEGDLVFFKINKSRISHVGIYLQRGFFVHASVSKGVMLNNLSEDYYKKYFFFWRQDQDQSTSLRHFYKAKRFVENYSHLGIPWKILIGENNYIC